MMKRRMISLVLLLFTCHVFYGQKLVLKGKVDDEVRTVVLKEFRGDSQEYELLKKIEVNDGRYEAVLNIDNQNLLLLDFGKEEVTLSYTNESMIIVDFIEGKFKFIGSINSQQLQKMRQENAKLQAKHFAKLKKDADAAMRSGDKEAMTEIQRRSASAIQNFLPELRDWIVSKGEGPQGYLAIQYSDFNKELPFIEARLAAFQEKLPKSQVTKALEIQVYRAKVLSIGMEPPAFEAIDIEDRVFSYNDYKGKILLVDFWAAWCKACRIENPQFAELYNDYKNKGLEVVSISQDEKVKVWQKAITKDGIGMWRHIQDKDRTISDLYGVSSLPQNLIIGKNGKILAKNLTADQLKTLLAKAL